MKSTPIIFRVDQGELHPVFCLRQITVSDDSSFLQKFVNVADEPDGIYQINVETLASWATPWPTDNKKVKRPDEALDSEELVKAFFAEADVDKDWIAEYAIRALRNRHSPSVSFF
jgi:hypothetical protein